MKTIAERAKVFAQKEKYIDCIGCDSCSKCKEYNTYVDIATEQKAIDDAELARLKKAWEKEAEVNHDAAMAYKQGYHDAIDKACEWLEGHAWIDGMEYRFDITDFRKAMEDE